MRIIIVYKGKQNLQFSECNPIQLGVIFMNGKCLARFTLIHRCIINVEFLCLGDAVMNEKPLAFPLESCYEMI